MSEPLVIETITDTYLPLAGGGVNTLRKVSDKYEALNPGDIVQMEYRAAVGEGAFATEKLIVASMVVGDLDALCEAHAKRNHGKLTPAKLRERMLELYSDPDAQYVVIYFV